jgi:hypothetical protein
MPATSRERKCATFACLEGPVHGMLMLAIEDIAVAIIQDRNGGQSDCRLRSGHLTIATGKSCRLLLATPSRCCQDHLAVKVLMARRL